MGFFCMLLKQRGLRQPEPAARAAAELKTRLRAALAGCNCLALSADTFKGPHLQQLANSGNYSAEAYHCKRDERHGDSRVAARYSRSGSMGPGPNFVRRRLPPRSAVPLTRSTTCSRGCSSIAAVKQAGWRLPCIPGSLDRKAMVRVLVG